MPFKSQRAKLSLTSKGRTKLEKISRSRTDKALRVERAAILLAYADGHTVCAIVRQLNTSKNKVNRCLNKALELGPEAALEDLPRPGRPTTISLEAKVWIMALACQKPKDLGYPEELWTTRKLTEHVRAHCTEAGHPDVAGIAPGTMHRLLSSAEIKAHKISYYLERRDPDFEEKMARVLCVYKKVEILRKRGEGDELTAVLSYDEKPGIQAIESTAEDRPPVPGQHKTWSRDFEYKRHGTLSLMAGMDLLSGHVHHLVTPRHRSREFIEFLKIVDEYYPPKMRLRLILDNHSAHISNETRGYLATRPNRFEFIFTPKHGSWLNLIETLFSKMARTLLRGIRVSSKAELRERIEKYLTLLNKAPVIFRWNYKMDTIPEESVHSEVI